jgi:hypothetical protein
VRNDGRAAPPGYRGRQLHHQGPLAGDRGEAGGDPAGSRVRVGNHAGRTDVRPQAVASISSAARQFLKIVRVLAWDADAADYYADIRHQLSTTGRPIDEMDMMIAAHALAIGAVLVTNNTRHFDRIAAPLSWVNWCEVS